MRVRGEVNRVNQRCLFRILRRAAASECGAVAKFSIDEFQHALSVLLLRAKNDRCNFVEVSARELHQEVASYPARSHRIPTCCRVMRRSMMPVDEIVDGPSEGSAASLRIRYHLPRPQKGRHIKAIEGALREFEGWLSMKPAENVTTEEWMPFQILTAEDSQWSFEEKRALKPEGYPKGLRGVYIYADECSSHAPHKRPDAASARFTVIRYIGVVITNFDDQRRTKESNNKQIPYRWIHIIPFLGRTSFLAPALERFLLREFRTTDNYYPRNGWHQQSRPVIFDERD